MEIRNTSIICLALILVLTLALTTIAGCTMLTAVNKWDEKQKAKDTVERQEKNKENIDNNMNWYLWNQK